MKFENTVIEGTLLKRYKRFLADIELPNGETVVAHVPNPGSMKGCSKPGSKCRVTHVDNPKRKLKYTLEMVKTPKSWVGVNTSLSNKLVHEAFYNKVLSHWKKYDQVKPEVRISDKSRVDFAMWKEGSEKKHYVEVKNVSLVVGDQAQFPDSVTLRGQKHLRELMELVNQGHTAELLFTVQRKDVTSFAPAVDIDPEYAKLLKEAKKRGVKITPLLCRISKNQIVLTDEKLKLKL